MEYTLQWHKRRETKGSSSTSTKLNNLLSGCAIGAIWYWWWSTIKLIRSRTFILKLAIKRFYLANGPRAVFPTHTEVINKFACNVAAELNTRAKHGSLGSANVWRTSSDTFFCLRPRSADLNCHHAQDIWRSQHWLSSIPEFHRQAQWDR